MTVNLPARFLQAAWVRGDNFVPVVVACVYAWVLRLVRQCINATAPQCKKRYTSRNPDQYAQRVTKMHTCCVYKCTSDQSDRPHTPKRP